ncbi:MAG: FAD:protein FMN transferase, partial [Gemmatimonadota bacterium]|nr:FAD:protein FMN transferase [Gemmatimonadota bacterium]
MTDRILSRPFGRREFIAIGTGAFAVAALPIALRRHVAVARRTVPVMGTIAELTVVHRHEATAQEALEAALAELRWVETTMTRFSATSDVGRANAAASRDGVAVRPETARLVEQALRWSSATDGRFDPALGAASELWDVTNRHEPPPADQVARLANRSFWRHVDLSVGSSQATLRFGERDLHLDLGGIGKGYAIDRATQALRDRGIEHAIVNLGGDLYALGESPEGGAWRVGIKSPDDLRRVARTFEVSNRAVATSGDYERFF